ncbi:hypothetical protein SAMN05444920_14018 [Nonomuraea solani]|uniref:HEAT repeat-containing protein n=1 Tax=Nonomuraea solani TaxID=1144553 RepID=A0A1H6F3R7_9ACTN|nr:hypothetical protein [Nonomuraea solani]SEH03604.1 hypothetical protein SAMN05444920_14018 [Nonomuraea solani]
MRPLEPAEEPALEIDLPAAALLARLAPLPPSRRARALALHARRLAGTSHLRVLLDELSAQDHYARHTALHLAMAARDLGFIEEVLAGPDMRVRRSALRAVRTLPVPDPAVRAALDDAPAELRRALYRTLAHSRRYALAEALLPDVRARWGDREAAALLPACGSAAVARWLPELAHAVTSWTTMAKRHAGAIMAVAEQELATGVHPLTWWRRRGAGVELAALSEPDRMLALLDRYDLGHVLAQFPGAVANALFRADAVRARRLFIDGAAPLWEEPPKALLRHVSSASDAELLRLASVDYHFDTVLRRLPPARRAAIFEAAAQRQGGGSRLWAMRLLRWLPPERAAAEARRLLEWHASVWHAVRSHLDDPDIPLELTSHLPYEEAVGPLREAAVEGDSRRRGLARTLLVRCTARTRDRALLHALLAELALRTVNERDPLRRDLLTALLELPPALLDDSFAATLGRIATDAAEAPDSSPGTREALRGLAGRVLRHHDPARAPALFSWGMGVYASLVARHGAAGLPALVPDPDAPRPAPARRRRRDRGFPGAPTDPHHLDRVLRMGQEQDLLVVLRPHLRAARDRGDFTVAVALAHTLGRRGWALGELQDDLRAAIRRAPEPLAREAAGLWLSRRPGHRRTTPPPEPGAGGGRTERVVGLVLEEPSAVTLPAVWGAVARHRPDLLLPLLEHDRRGRFADPAWVPPVVEGEARRWSPDQRDRVRAKLAATVGDERLPVSVRAAAVQAFGRAGGGLDVLAMWADHENTVLAEAAITAMAGADAMPLLLRHAGGPASRVAVAALARACRSASPSRLGPFLEQALTAPESKITLRRLAARQLGRNRPPGAVEVLLRAWADPGLHRDVRATVATVLRGMPEDPRTLAALTETPGRYTDELILRTLFQAHPMEYAPAARPGYADLVRRLLMSTDLPGVRFRGSKAFGVWAHWYRGGFEEILEAAADPGADEKITQVFLALLRAGAIRSETLGVLARLAAAVPGEDLPAPARTRLTTITRSLAMMLEEEQPWRRRLAQDAMDLLTTRPLLLTEAVGLAIALLPTSDAELGDALCALADLLGDRPILAAHTARGAAYELYDGGWRRSHVQPPATLPAIRRLTARGDLAGALFAITLTQWGGGHTDWAPPWPEIIRDLRDSPHLEIREQAWNTSVD